MRTANRPACSGPAGTTRCAGIGAVARIILCPNVFTGAQFADQVADRALVANVEAGQTDIKTRGYRDDTRHVERVRRILIYR